MMAQQSQPKYEPVRAYVLKEVYYRFRAKIMAKGLTFSAWLRRKINEELDSED